MAVDPSSQFTLPEEPVHADTSQRARWNIVGPTWETYTGPWQRLVELPLRFVAPTAGAAVHPQVVATMKAKVREAEAAGRRAVALSFVARVKDDERVREVWFDDASDDAALTLVVERSSLDDELHFEAVFSAEIEQHDDTFHGYLSVYSHDDGVPDSVRRGDRLLP